jgi:hypothetical protein
MKYFANCRTLDDLKAEYRRLAKRHHPDLGGDKDTMQAINAEYETAFEILKKQHNAAADDEHQTQETPADFIRIIDALLKISGIEVELCGRWLWISGDTYTNRAALKEAGCRWSKSKGKWYWRFEKDAGPWHRGNKTMDAIRRKYGSQIFDAAGERSAYEPLPA